MPSSMAKMREFYDAFFPRLEEAIEYCDKFSLDNLPEDAMNLLRLVYSLIMVAMSVEIMHQVRPTDAVMTRISEPVPLKGHAMSLLTVNKLTDSVGAEVSGNSWSVSDTVIRDNRGVLHRAAPYEPDSPREMCGLLCSATSRSGDLGRLEVARRDCGNGAETPLTALFRRDR